LISIYVSPLASASTSVARWFGEHSLLVTVLVVLTATAVTLAGYLSVLIHRQRAQLRSRRADQTALEKLYAELVEKASDVIFQLDADGRIMAMNQAGAKMLGTELHELLGRRLTEFMPPSELDRLSLDGSKEYNFGEMTLMDSQRRPVFLETSYRRTREEGKVRSIEFIARNVTERRSLETQVRQSERMQAMGFLAGGVAHDFNNYLTVILTYVDLALESTKDSEQLSLLQEIRTATRSAAGMAQKMLDFSRGHTVPPKPLSLNDVITGMQRLLQSSVGKKVTLNLQLASQLPKVVADRGSIEQVLLNLAINARDAMSQGGELTIRTLIKPPNYVVLETSDTGQGMDEVTKSQIFQPFFTTKEEGKGAGLGLATVQRIVIKTGGKIHVETKPGAGTTFHLEFPTATHGDVSREAVAERSPSPPRLY